MSAEEPGRAVGLAIVFVAGVTVVWLLIFAAMWVGADSPSESKRSVPVSGSAVGAPRL